METALEKRESPENSEKKREDLTLNLYLDLALRQAEEALPAHDRIVALAKGETIVEEDIVTKDGDIITLKRKPNHRVQLDANKIIVEAATAKKEQVHTHKFDFNSIDRAQAEDFIFNIFKECAVDVEFTPIENNQGNAEPVTGTEDL